jgi:hypothetical protein
MQTLAPKVDVTTQKPNGDTVAQHRDQKPLFDRIYATSKPEDTDEHVDDTRSRSAKLGIVPENTTTEDHAIIARRKDRHTEHLSIGGGRVPTIRPELMFQYNYSTG